MGSEEGSTMRNSIVCTLHLIYLSQGVKSRRLGLAGYVARIEEGGSAFKILTGKPKGKRPLGRPRRRWENNIRIDLKKIGINTRNLVDSARDRDYCRLLVNAALNLQVTSHGVR